MAIFKQGMTFREYKNKTCSIGIHFPEWSRTKDKIRVKRCTNCKKVLRPC